MTRQPRTERRLGDPADRMVPFTNQPADHSQARRSEFWSEWRSVCDLYLGCLVSVGLPPAKAADDGRRRPEGGARRNATGQTGS